MRGAQFGAILAQFSRNSRAILAQFSRNSLTRHPSPPGGGLLVPGASIRVLLPTGEELFLGDTKASGRDACVLRVTNADMFEKVTLLPARLTPHAPIPISLVEPSSYFYR